MWNFVVKNWTTQQKEFVAAEKMVHSRQVKKFYTKKTTLLDPYKDDDTVAIISIDYMQNLPLLQVQIQSAFYLRQLTVNCFCIHNEKVGHAKLYVYHESTGGKGPNEVYSFLKLYFDDEIYIPKKTCKLFWFSDGCSGQNGNHGFVFLLHVSRNSVLDRLSIFLNSRALAHIMWPWFRRH